jgi:paraquat-inducible protein A
MKKMFSRSRRALHPWPKPPGGPHRSVCHVCDTVHEAKPLKEGQAAYCARCGTILYQNRPASLARATAFSIASLTLMLVANCFPFLILDKVGIRTSLNLIPAAMTLVDNGSPILAIALALFTVVTPLVMAGGLIYVCGPLMFGRAAPGATHVAKWLNRLEPWNMIEVFALGLLVSLLKLGKVAEITPAEGSFAFGALMFCMAAAVASIDRDELWDRLEVAKR